MQSKSNLSHMSGDLTNVQVISVRAIDEYCIPLDVPNLTSPLCLNCLDNCVIPYA